MHLPELLGPYLLHRVIARGTTSDVFLAQTTGEFPRICVVKVIRPEVAALPGFAHRFRTDAALLVRLIHGNLVQVLEVGAVEERLFVAMELIDGVDVSELVSEVPEQGALPPEFALYVALEMCEAATYIQLHRQDQTGQQTFPPDTPWPLELMVSFDGVVKVVDLGSFGAIHLGQQRVSRLFHSPGYAVPEVVLKRPLDARSDLFAIGVVLWELLEGRRLISSDPETYVRAVLQGSWKAPLIRRRDVSGDVIRLAGELLSLEPARRPVGIDAVRSRLVAALRRVAPAYGSSGVARLLWHRCQHLISETERMVTDVIRVASTDRDFPTGLPTQSFGHVSHVDRPLGPPAPLRPGDPVPGTRYRVVRQVGEGGSAQVFAAQHIDLDRQVAIKVLSARLASNSAAIAQFRMEARACSRVGHPNIVEVIDFGELEDGRFFFAMELLDGESLADVLDTHGKLPPGRAIGIFRQIAKALHATHKHGIVHRDLKPENVMLVGREGRPDFVKLLDFGVMAFGSQASGRAVGTTGYMAPEQVRGEAPLPSMDVYAVGAALYEVLAGAPPYECETYEEFAALQAKSPPPALRSRPGAADLPEGLERVVHRALERDPAARHPSMADFEADLIRAQNEAAIETEWDDLPDPHDDRVDRRSGKLPAVTPAPRRVSSRVWMVSFGLVLAAVLVLAVAQLYTREPPPPPPRAVPARPAVRRAEGPSPAVTALLRRVDRAAAQGRFTHPPGENALDLLRRLEQDAPELVRSRRASMARLLEGAGDRLVAAGMDRSARTLYREALLFSPGSRRLARLAEVQAMSAGSGRSRPRRPEARLSEVAWLLSQVQLAVMEGRYIAPAGRSALSLLTRLKQVDPGGERLAAAQGSMARTLRRRADALWDHGERDQARPLYRLVLALDDGDRVAHRRSREVPDAVEPTAEARAPVPAPSVEPAREKRSVHPEQAREHVARGRALLRQGDLDRAEASFEAAVTANPGEVGAYAGLAAVSFERARYSRTVDLARRVVRMSPRQVQGHILLGDAYFKLLRYADALKAWERVLQLDPDNRGVTRRIERLKRRVN